jgi:ribosome-binding protein aMBF1 (putative translation factor)
MSDAKGFYRKFWLRWLAGLLALLSVAMWAQATGQQQSSTASSQAPTKTDSQAPQSQKPAGEAAAAPRKISPKQADELFRSVDEILQFAGKDSGLPIRQTVNRQLTSRDQVVAYLEKSMAGLQPAVISVDPAEGAGRRVLRSEDQDGESA